LPVISPVNDHLRMARFRELATMTLNRRGYVALIVGERGSGRTFAADQLATVAREYRVRVSRSAEHEAMLAILDDVSNVSDAQLDAIKEQVSLGMRSGKGFVLLVDCSDSRLYHAFADFRPPIISVKAFDEDELQKALASCLPSLDQDSLRFLHEMTGGNP